MRRGFYSGMAWNNLKKNRRFFIPRILTESGLLGCFYILLTLSMDSRLHDIKGGNYIPTFMMMGVIVMIILSSVLMFYVNSFLMKQRTTEFGLYNILGMEKRHIGRVLFWESGICATAAMALGLVFGILFYKISSLAICRLLNVDVILGFYFIKAITILPSALFFLGLDLLIYLINRISIARMKPVEMMARRHAGEREPKVRWVMLILGVLSLGAGYYMALTTESPLLAISKFFEAVILVIIGTYFLFVTGTIWVLKIMKKNERYYYNKRRMPAISGLLYRMKQNAVGLASICILSTGVLVMISTTFSLYAGIEDTIANNYPQDWYLNASYTSESGEERRIAPEVMETFVRNAAGEQGVTVESIYTERFLSSTYMLYQGELIGEQNTNLSYDHLTIIVLMTAEDYNLASGQNVTLAKDEALVCPYNASAEAAIAGDDTISIEGLTLKYKERLTHFPIASDMNLAIDTIGLVVADEEVFRQIYEIQKKLYGENASEIRMDLAVTYAEKDRILEVGDAMYLSVWEQIQAYLETQDGFDGAMGMQNDSVWDTRTAVFGMYGTLLFLGILLGLVFLFATALIIYYKQISEGFEDRERFQIMEKIGMSSVDVQKTIHSQILMVFFLPLIVAGIHIAVAFPILTKLLHVMLLSSDWFFVKCTIGVYVGFGLIYALIYRATSRTYYSIVK